MTNKILTDLMGKYGNVQRVEDTLQIPPETDVTLFVAVGSDPLIVRKVSQLELLAEVAIASTVKSEHYVVAYQDIRSIKIATGRGRTTGY